MIKCEQCLEVLSAYVDGELPEDEKKKLDMHLRECNECSKELELLKAIVSVCKDLTEELPENFEASLHERLKKAKEDFQGEKRKVLNLRLISQIAAGFIIVVTLGIFIRLGMGRVSMDHAGEAPAKSLKIAEQTADMNATLAMSSRNGDAARGAVQSPSATIAGMQDMDEQVEETAAVPEDKIMLSMGFTENYEYGFRKVEGYDTQVRIETEDLSGAVESIMIIEEKLGGSTENKSSLQKLALDYGGSWEEPVQMELYYPNDETWHAFLSELQVVFPGMEIESVPAEGEREQIRIILSKIPE